MSVDEYNSLMTQVENYLGIGFIMLMLYDHLITLDKEVEWIWSLKWRLPKIIFFFNRYCVFPLLTFQAITSCVYPLSHTFCTFVVQLVLWLPIATFTGVELVLIVRVCALYGCGKIITSFVITVFGFAIIAAIVIASIGTRTYAIVPVYASQPGCPFDFPISWTTWLPFLILEFIFIILTLYKVFVIRQKRNRTVTVLARDSIIYFLLVFVCLLWRELSYVFVIDIALTIPAQCMATIAVGRMMMNIRGLILDDPDHTTYHQTLGTLQFAAATTDLRLDDETAV